VAKRRRDVRRSFNRGRQNKKRLKRIKDVDPAILAALRASLGREPTAEDARNMQQQMVQTALQRMVELKLAQWIESALFVLRDDFQFNEEQLAQFLRNFREKVDGAEKETPTPTDTT
jgi:phage terminase large subunit-like protein